jgi:predicted dehydrogenase
LKKTVNVAIASYGMSGMVFHAPLLTSHPGFKLTKIMERSSQRSKGRYPEVAVVTKFEDLLSDSSIDLIIVNTPNGLHFEQASQALNAGKHVVERRKRTWFRNTL